MKRQLWIGTAARKTGARRRLGRVLAALCALSVAGPLGGLVTTASAQDLANGEAIYDDDCADCHGATGKGDGPFARLGGFEVRDFTSGPLVFDTNGDCAVGTAADFFDVIRQGAETFGGDENMEPRSPVDLSDDDVNDVIAFIQDEFTSQIPPVACDLCGEAVPLTGKGKLKVKGKGKAKEKLDWDVTLDESGSWSADDGSETFEGCWRAVGSSGRKYALSFSDTALAAWLDRLEALAQADVSRKVGELDAKRDPKAKLKANKKGTKAKLKLKLKLDAEVGRKSKKGAYSAKLKGPL